VGQQWPALGQALASHCHHLSHQSPEVSQQWPRPQPHARLTRVSNRVPDAHEEDRAEDVEEAWHKHSIDRSQLILRLDLRIWRLFVHLLERADVGCEGVDVE
jgi:hypothetical protein